MASLDTSNTSINVHGDYRRLSNDVDEHELSHESIGVDIPEERQRLLQDPVRQQDDNAITAAGLSRSFGGRNNPPVTDYQSLKKPTAASAAANTYSTTGSPRKPYQPKQGSLHYNRMRYYNRLSQHSGHDLTPPAHIIDPSILLFTHTKGKQSSLTTIFSIWNTMVGSTLLVLPWAFSQAGLAMGIGTTLLIGAVALYTALLIVRHSGDYDDFADLCRAHLGDHYRYLAWGSSLMVLVGAAIVYFTLMSSFFYSVVLQLAQFSDNQKLIADWSAQVAPVLLLIIMYPICALKDFSLLVRFNSFGVICVFYNLFFLIYRSLTLSDEFFTQSSATTRPTPAIYIPIALYENNFVFLAGILPVSFFIHNLVIVMLKNQRHPEHNQRDLGIAFLLVCFCYLAVGVVGYIAFRDVEIEQNFLQNFPTHDLWAFAARASLLLQLSTVFPVIMYIVRIQTFGVLFQKQWPGLLPVLGLNTTIIGVSVLFAVFYPQVGTLLRYTGALCGMIYVFLLPVLVHLKLVKLSLASRIGHYLIIALGFAVFVAQFV